VTPEFVRDEIAHRDVVANIQFFGPETANFLEYRLNAQAANLPSLCAKSWALIIRHMRAARRGRAQNDWFEIAPQLKRGDHSNAVLERLANALRPKLKIGERLSWSATEAVTPQRPSDLMSIEYDVEDSVSSDHVLAAWPSDAAAETDENLLLQLTIALSAALADATDVGVHRAVQPLIGPHGPNRHHPLPRAAHRSYRRFRCHQLLIRTAAVAAAAGLLDREERDRRHCDA
jgi:hypothetical protein